MHQACVSLDMAQQGDNQFLSLVTLVEHRLPVNRSDRPVESQAGMVDNGERS